MKARTILPPATGTCRWVGEAANGNPLLEITTEAVSHIYEINSRYGGYDLHYFDRDRNEFRRYKIDVSGEGYWVCTCPDAIHRPERKYTCKHTLALKAALIKSPF